jgi:hypothetical protein
MNAWRMVGMAALCAAFVWGCENRRTSPEVADRPVLQAPDMAAPMGERSAASAETVRQGEENGAQANPAEVPGSRQVRQGGETGQGGAGAAGQQQLDPAPGGAGQPGTGTPRERAQDAAGRQQLDPAPGGAGQPGTGTPRERAQDAKGGAADEGVQAPTPEEARGLRDDHTTLIVPDGPGPNLAPEVLRDAERAAQAAREDTGDERVVVANVEFGGRLQQVSEDRVVVRDLDGNLYEAQVEEGSRLLRSGEAVTAEQLRQGTDVRASLDLVEGGFVVRELEQLPRR